MDSEAAFDLPAKH